MALTPILASDTTAEFLRYVVILYWIVVAIVTVPGLVAVIMFCGSREARYLKFAGLLLGFLSAAAGGVCFMYFLISADHPGPLVRLAASTPLVIGVLALVLWILRKPT